MKVLVLSMLDEKDQYVYDYTEKMASKMDLSVHVLNIVPVPADVPLQADGRVLDNCTEFDLSGYLEQQLENQLVLANLGMTYETASSIVGRPMPIIEAYVKANNIDLIISVAEISSGVKSLFTTTLSSQIIKEIGIPYLTLKCDRSWEEIQRIGLVGDFKHAEKRNLSVLKQLQKAFKAAFYLFTINTSNDFQSETDAKRNMEEFARINGLSDVSYYIYSAKDKKSGIINIIVEYKINLMALGMVGHKGIFGDFKREVVNEVATPLFTYSKN